MLKRKAGAPPPPPKGSVKAPGPVSQPNGMS